MTAQRIANWLTWAWEAGGRVVQPRSPGVGQESVGTRLHGYHLLAARAMCIGTVLGVAGLLLVAFPARYQQLADTFQSLSPAQAAVLRELGISGLLHARLLVTVEATVAMAFLGVSVLILCKRSDDWLALHVAAALAAYMAWIQPSLESLAATPSEWQMAARIAQALGMAGSVAFFFVFPDGRFVPGWTRPLLVLLFGWAAAWVLLPGSVFDLSNPFRLSLPTFVMDMAWWTMAMGAQVYRLTRVATPVQRQQTKWILGASVIGMVAYLLFGFDRFALPAFQEARMANVVYDLVGVPLFLLSMLILPVGFAVSILRYRLWDIEGLISRALVYGSMTAIVAGLYPTMVGFFQRLFVALTGDHSEAAIVICTLIVASALTPLKNSLQRIVDRYLKQSPNPMSGLQTFTGAVHAIVDVLDCNELTRKALLEAIRAFDAAGGAVYLADNGHLRLAHTSGEGGQVEGMAAWLESGGTRYGRMVLGPRRAGAAYTPRERELFESTAALVARAIHFSELMDACQVPSAPVESPRLVSVGGGAS